MVLTRGVITAGRDFKRLSVPSCGFNQLTSSARRDRQLETQLDKLFDVEEPRNSHDSVRSFLTHVHVCHNKLLIGRAGNH